MHPRRLLSRRFALGAAGLLLLSACETTTRPARGPLPEDGSIDLLSLLADKPEHSRFLNALRLSGQAGRVGRENGAVTLFVPTNEALAGLPADLLALLDNPPANPTPEQRARAATLVNANAAFGLLRLADIEPRRGQVVTWDRGRILVQRSGAQGAIVQREGVPVQPGRPPVAITRADVLASDGVFHVISAPILPSI